MISPEHDTGARVARSLVSAAFTDWIELSNDFSLVEAQIPGAWVGKTLEELRVRERYGVNIVGLIHDEKISVILNPQAPLPEKCLLILIGADKNLEFLRNGDWSSK